VAGTRLFQERFPRIRTRSPGLHARKAAPANVLPGAGNPNFLLKARNEKGFKTQKALI
jgi:hypothetical protein